MINDPQKQPSNEVVDPLLADILNGCELNKIIQDCSSSEKGAIEIKISQNGQQFFRVNILRYGAGECPCGQHSDGCTHRLNANGSAIC